MTSDERFIETCGEAERDARRAARVDWLIEVFCLACVVAWLFETVFGRMP